MSALFVVVGTTVITARIRRLTFGPFGGAGGLQPTVSVTSSWVSDLGK
jgi:hypothetical protein